jgi:hypothetical protein
MEMLMFSVSLVFEAGLRVDDERLGVGRWTNVSYPQSVVVIYEVNMMAKQFGLFPMNF